MLLVTVLLIFYVNVAIGVGCEIGQQSCDLFIEEINDKFDQIDWYLYPIEIRRTLPTVFVMAQKAVCLEFFGSMTASRDTFKKVCDPSSYYQVMPYQWQLIISSFTFRY